MALPRVDISYKIDEGYSEDTRSQDDIDSPMKLEHSNSTFPSAMRLAMGSVMSLSEDDKSEFVCYILQTLRTSSIAAIVERMRPHLHRDPVTYLPPEITSEIFSYLTPSMLLDAAKVSQTWRERTLDSRLWKQKFFSEGWDLELEELRSVEPSPPSPRKSRGRRAETHGEQRRQKKRIRASSGVDLAMAQTALRESYARRREIQSWSAQNGEVEADPDQDITTQGLAWDEEMHDMGNDVSSTVANTGGTCRTPGPPTGESSMSLCDKGKSPEPTDHVDDSGRATENARARRSSDISMGIASQSHVDSDPPLVTYSVSGQPRLNYQQLYKQRRKLEDNWTACAYKSFQLPHRDHPEEAHGECVYTIQYIGRYLVSGSRDRTLRKWDLETQRLIGKPLQGHSASVLCLQFDNSKEEDIIMSGSSDTDVIIWRFSTGEIVERISQAHREPVLNLKFDHRYLATCSKDKTIKLWNRHKLSPGDRDYPIRGVKNGGRCPAYIVDLSNVGANPFDIHKYLTPEQRQPLKAYTNLMTLDSHSAAVNAIHIYKDQLVSASGDRFVKVWNIHTGECTATCRGHQKGIACVQYDGKRIISGSSDNTIRIYDPETQGEVACLQGHTRLVRTIQSAFEDLPGTRDDLAKEAEGVDGQFFQAHEGRFPEYERTRRRNPGSNLPENITAVGLKLPPGGGGSRWGRIVSGSYDETIIIWRKGSDGRWVPGHRLRQEEALRAAGGPLPSLSDPQPPLDASLPLTARRLASAQGAATSQQARSSPDPPSDHANTNPHAQVAHWQAQQAQQSSHHPPVSQAALGPTQGSQPRPVLTSEGRALKRAQSSAPRSTEAEACSSRNTTTSHVAAQRPDRPSPVSGDLEVHTETQVSRLHQQSQPKDSHHLHQLHYHQSAGQTQRVSNPDNPLRPSTNNIQQTAQPQQDTPNPPMFPNPVHPPAAHAPHAHFHPPHHHHAAAGPPGGQMQQPNARVFKLQFDARRIICCSQDPKIVGWDFANSDERIIEASRFFKAPQ